MITLAELSARIKPGDPSIEQRLIEPIRKGVIALFETKTCRYWERRVGFVDTQRPDDLTKGRDLAALWVPLYPIETLAIVERDYRGADVAVPAADIDFDPVGGRVVRVNGRWGDVVTATITGGYTPETAPQDVREALMAQAVFCYVRLSPQLIATRSQAFEIGSTQYLTPDFHPLFELAVQTNFRRAF